MSTWHRIHLYDKLFILANFPITLCLLQEKLRISVTKKKMIRHILCRHIIFIGSKTQICETKDMMNASTCSYTVSIGNIFAGILNFLNLCFEVAFVIWIFSLKLTKDNNGMYHICSYMRRGAFSPLCELTIYQSTFSKAKLSKIIKRKFDTISQASYR